MKKILLATAFIAFGIFSANAQYQNAIGVRGGLYNGITYKKSLGNNQLELIGASRWRSINLTALFEKPNAISEVEGLYWFWGVGAHIGFWDAYYNPWFDDGANHTVIGADGIIGIEYVFDEIPICLSLDYKPAFNFIGDIGFWGDNGALSIRYTF